VELTDSDPFLAEYESFMQYQSQLCCLSFHTVDEYLAALQCVAETVSASCPAPAVFYLAAAVSDFYIPQELMAEHKIQSGSGALNLRLEPVPKMLGELVRSWAPSSFVASFKLETDTDMVLKKARQAIEKYNVHVVVANQLQVRMLMSLSYASDHVILSDACALSLADEAGSGLLGGAELWRWRRLFHRV
jgi:hypothetical protein